MQDNLKDLSDRQLLGTMQTGTVPEYLVIAELQRRKKARQDAAPQQQRQPQSTVAEELMSGIAAAPAPNMQQFSAGGVVPFQEGGPTNWNQERIKAMMRANLRHMLSRQGVAPEQARQISDQAKNASIEQLETLMSQFGIAGAPEPRADVPMPSAPTLFPAQDYAGQAAERIAEEGRIDTSQYGAPGAGVAVGAAKDLTLSGLRALESAAPVESAVRFAEETAVPFLADVAGDVGERVAPIFETGPQLVGEDIYEAVDPYLTRFGSFLDERVGKPLEAWLDTRGEPKAYPPNNELMAREAEMGGVSVPTTPATPAAPASSPLPSPAAPTQDEILRVGRADDATSTAPTAPAGPQVGTEQLAGMGEAELAQTREVAKERPDFFSPEALLALGIGMIAGGSKPGSTFGSAVGEGGLAMLQQVQSQRKAEAEREEAEMLEAGRMERTRMEQAGALQRAGINAAAYDRQLAALNLQRASELAKIELNAFTEPTSRARLLSARIEALKNDPKYAGKSKNDIQQEADAQLTQEELALRTRLKQLTLGQPGSRFGAPAADQSLLGPYNIRYQ